MNLCQIINIFPFAAWIAGLALIVSLLQLKIANLKIKLDLYDKRFRIYQSVTDFANAKHDDEKLSEIEKKIDISFRESHFLFKKSDLMSMHVLAVKTKKEEIFKHLKRDMSAAEVLYDKESINKRKEEYEKNKESLHKLVVDFEKKISKYIEFRNINGFDIKSIFSKN
jgi:hypothetical protein